MSSVSHSALCCYPMDSNYFIVAVIRRELGLVNKTCLLLLIAKDNKFGSDIHYIWTRLGLLPVFPIRTLLYNYALEELILQGNFFFFFFFVKTHIAWLPASKWYTVIYAFNKCFKQNLSKQCFARAAHCNLDAIFTGVFLHNANDFLLLPSSI